MKKFFTFFILSIFCMGMAANPIGIDQARGKAARFLSESRTAKIKNVQQLEKSLKPVETGFSHLHIFNNGQDGGFVVVSADDRTDEVLAYSEGGSFDDLPQNGGIYEILAGLNSQVLDAAVDYTFTSRNETEPQQQDRDPIYPMITTSWNQYQPYYDFTPIDPYSGDHTLVGCVAITLAQIMKYYEYPQKTTKSIPAYTTQSGIKMPELSPTTFEYDKMVDFYSSLGDYYNDEQLAAVHKILKYAGCAVKMEYSSGGSAATFDVGLISKYFGYRDDAKLLHAALFPRHQWEEMIYNELAAGRPVPYSAGAVLQQNHSFIVDGYDGRGYFHFNTGEFGYFAGQIYSKLHVINDCENQTDGVEFSGYNCYQSAIFNFQPKDSGQPLQTLPEEENMDGKVSKLKVNGVHFYSPYPNSKTVAIVDVTNKGETYENYLFLWQGETLKGGVGTYIPPGERGEVVICLVDYATGKYPVRFTTDWEGKDEVYNTTMEIVEKPEFKLKGHFAHEGYKGYIWINEETSEYPYPYWDWDNTWQGEIGIYDHLKIEADITNVSDKNYNSWISSCLSDLDPEGGTYVYQDRLFVNHYYYVDLAPGETKHFTFYFGKGVFRTDKLYYYMIDYCDRQGNSFFALPSSAKYFPSTPEGIEEISTDIDDTPSYNLLGIPIKNDAPGIHIRKGKKYVVK